MPRATEPQRILPMEEPGKSGPKKGTLAAIVGTIAAGILFTQTPHEESGRKVAVSIANDGTATVKHVAGRQYLDAYLDIAGIPTACDGITKGVRMGQRYTEAQCTALLEAELVKHAQGVMACSSGLRAPGRDYQRAASVMLAYNIGVAGFCGSTARKRFDAGDLRGGCDAFLSWNKARVGGVLRPVQGLTSRRQRERALCMKGLA